MVFSVGIQGLLSLLGVWAVVRALECFWILYSGSTHNALWFRVLRSGRGERVLSEEEALGWYCFWG